MKSMKSERFKKTHEEIRETLNDEQKRLNDLNLKTSTSAWLTTLPIKDEGYVLNKQCFWDLICLRYGWRLKHIPETCPCGKAFNFQHAFQCAKGGFISLRHNRIRNITANLLTEVCKDVRVEPQLQSLSGEVFAEASTNVSDQARADISARSFWLKGQVAFFDVRVFNPIAKRYDNQTLRKAYDINEKEKKRQYNERIMQVEHGTFTPPPVMSTYGGMGRECRTFYSRLSEMIAEKRKVPYSIIASWVRRKIMFAIVNSLCICLRGSRSVSYSSNAFLESSLTSYAKISEAGSMVEKDLLSF